MHLITLQEDLFSADRSIALKRDQPYFIETSSLPQIASMVDGNLSAEPASIAKGQLADFAPGTAPRILVCRAGAAGDILFLTPLLRELRRLFPLGSVHLATYEQFSWCAAALADSVVPFPLTPAKLELFDWVIDLENAAENERERDIVDAFCDRAGVRPIDRALAYQPATDLKEQLARFPRKVGVRRVALHVAASSPVRTYPHTEELYLELIDSGYEVVVYGAPGTIPFNSEKSAIDLTKLGESWQWNIDFLRTCDAVVGPDSSVIHYAGAMGLPVVGLFASFLGKLRSPGWSTKVLQAQGACAPCFHHARRGYDFPPHGPCQKSGRCDVLASIPVEKVMNQIQRKLLKADAQEIRDACPKLSPQVDAAEAACLAKLEA